MKPNLPRKIELPETSNQSGLPQKQNQENQFTKSIPPLISLRTMRDNANRQVTEIRKNTLIAHIKTIEKERDSSVIIYHSRNLLDENEVKAFYQLFSGNKKLKNLDLIIFSYGGISDAAFKMYRLCRQHTENRFGVLVPYKAKSAATLITLGSDDLVMGSPSEIGPIDPMIYVHIEGNKVLVPVHSIKDGLDFIDGRIKNQPETENMYARLTESLNITVVGAYQRAIDSAQQYAEVLLRSGLLKNDPDKSIEVAKKLAWDFKSHAYAIDKDIAKNELSLPVTDASDLVWESMWQIHNIIEVMFEEDPKLGAYIKTSNSEILLTLNPQERSNSNG